MSYDDLSPTNRTDLCDGAVFLGRSNEHVEGHDTILETLPGFLKVFLNLQTPTSTNTRNNRLLQDVTRLSVTTLSNGENQAVDLKQLESGVNTKSIINTDMLGIAWSGLLALNFFLLATFTGGLFF
mgnify:CR=1 FL=1